MLTNQREIPAVRYALMLIYQTTDLMREIAGGGSSEYFQHHQNKIREGTLWSRKEAFKKIQAKCHPKAFDDMFAHGTSWEIW